MTREFGYYLETNSLDEKRIILKELFDAYVQLRRGVLPVATQHLNNAESLLGKTEELKEVEHMVQTGFINDAELELETIIQYVVLRMKVYK